MFWMKIKVQTLLATVLSSLGDLCSELAVKVYKKSLVDLDKHMEYIENKLD